MPFKVGPGTLLSQIVCKIQGSAFGSPIHLRAFAIGKKPAIAGQEGLSFRSLRPWTKNSPREGHGKSDLGGRPIFAQKFIETFRQVLRRVVPQQCARFINEASLVISYQILNLFY